MFYVGFFVGVLASALLLLTAVLAVGKRQETGAPGTIAPNFVPGVPFKKPQKRAPKVGSDFKAWQKEQEKA